MRIKLSPVPCIKIRSHNCRLLSVDIRVLANNTKHDHHSPVYGSTSQTQPSYPETLASSRRLRFRPRSFLFMSTRLSLHSAVLHVSALSLVCDMQAGCKIFIHNHFPFTFLIAITTRAVLKLCAWLSGPVGRDQPRSGRNMMCERRNVGRPCLLSGDLLCLRYCVWKLTIHIVWSRFVLGGGGKLCSSTHALDSTICAMIKT